MTHPPNQSTSNSSLTETAQALIQALGGQDNIEYVTACATRLRVSLKDSQQADKESLKQLGATAVLEVENGIQAIYGGKSNLYSQEINHLLGSED